jgi:isopropylmalate/homocitrate/citramalate synthase
MSLLTKKRPGQELRLKNRSKPELYRDTYPYTRISRVRFDDVFIMPRPAEPMFITDTTFRDGQQARPPYSVEQMVRIYDLLHRLGGKGGLIRASEFFMYSEKDRRAIEACRAKDFPRPKVTGWIRCSVKDLKLARDMEFDEVGMLTSVSDYHLYLKLGKDRAQAMRDYLAVVEQALEWGIAPRCHFEDVTRADIFGFCVPFAQKLMRMAEDAGLPIKIRLCDTLGYGVPYPGAALPRSVPRIVRAFTDEAGVPGQWLEWHGHNDFHKVLVNTATAWLYGCAGANGTLLGFGERTGNAPVEALVVEYISLTGDDDAADPRVIAEIGRYFTKELGYDVPHNYPFVGQDFNATSAGIHVDGLAKNEEIYNIFDTRLILGRSVPIIITDKSGRAGVAYWINQHLDLEGEQAVDKRHPAVGKIYAKIMAAYDEGRTTSFSNQEMLHLVKRYLPELFPTELDKLKSLAQELAAHLIDRLSEECTITGVTMDSQPCMKEFLQDYPFIQFCYLVDVHGRLRASAVADPEKYRELDQGTDFSGREWFQVPMQTGKLHITDFYQSHFTRRLCLTVAAPVTDEGDEIIGVLGADIRLEELLKRQGDLEDETQLV